MVRDITDNTVGGGGEAAIDSESIIKGVEYNKKPHHDTLYITRRQFQMLKSYVSVGDLNCNNIDSVRFSGVTAEVLPGIVRPIVCEKGEVFPLAKDWKTGEISHE
jgi:hypothetical protein